MNNILFFEDTINGFTETLIIALVIVGALIVLVSIFAFCVSIYLTLSYIKYNRKKNSSGVTGEEACRKILDDNDLTNIKITKNGSILFGNSYSHYFKRVRLRRLTYRKKSITSLAMASQKASLAILDKEGDEDMKKRIKLTPLVVFGPFAFIPILLIGLVLDVLFFNCEGYITIISIVLGFVIFICAFVCAFMEIKTEKKAQIRAIQILEEDGLATEDERKMIKQLFKLYNIEYINNFVLAILEVIYDILKLLLSIATKASDNS